MELITGRKPTSAESGDDGDLVKWVSSMMDSRERAEMVLDRKLFPVKEEMIGLLRIALRCTRVDPALRPSMNTIVQFLT